jgi:hypothetical protein
MLRKQSAVAVPGTSAHGRLRQAPRRCDRPRLPGACGRASGSPALPGPAPPLTRHHRQHALGDERRCIRLLHASEGVYEAGVKLAAAGHRQQQLDGGAALAVKGPGRRKVGLVVRQGGHAGGGVQGAGVQGLVHLGGRGVYVCVCVGGGGGGGRRWGGVRTAENQALPDSSLPSKRSGAAHVDILIRPNGKSRGLTSPMHSVQSPTAGGGGMGTAPAGSRCAPASNAAAAAADNTARLHNERVWSTRPAL